MNIISALVTQGELKARQWVCSNVEQGRAGRFTITGQSVDWVLAKELLSCNRGNRKMCSKHVQLLANAIHNGEWIETGDTIKMSNVGKLLDGQHRLEAIRRSSRAVKVDFAFGIEEEAQTRIDVNKVRQPGQQLHMSGVKHGNVMAAAARIMKTLEKGHMRTDPTISKHAIYEFCMRDKVLQQCAAEAVVLRNKLGGKSSASGICVGLYLLNTAKVAQQIDVREFIQSVDKGANLQEDSPILHLRNNLVRGSNASNNNISYDISAWFLKAFALHVRNEPCQKLHFSPSREHFPDLAKLLA